MQPLSTSPRDLVRNGARVEFTPQAQGKLKEYLAEEQGRGLRIFLENGQYVLGFDKPGEHDHIFEYDGFKLLVDPPSLKYVTGLRVDFVEDEGGPVFELSNAFSSDGGCREGKGNCGCGKTKV